MSLTDLFDRAGGVTRRRLAKGAAAAGAIAAVTALAGCSDDGGGASGEGEPQVVNDSSKVIDALDDYESADLGVNASQTWTLPLGTLLFHCEGRRAAAMLAPESAVSPNALGFLSLATGGLTTLLSAPTKGRGYSFHDVRCGDGVYSWLEMDYRQGSWVLLAQPFSQGSLTGQVTQLDAGDEDWEPPTFTCVGTSVIWQKMPTISGKKSAQASKCCRWSAGDAEPSDLWTSQGRFATPPRVSASTLTITPRVRTGEGTYYGLTALDLKDAKPSQLDQLVLPAGVRPFDAVYTGKEFAFSIEASYDSAGSLGKMGTFIGREGGPYVYFGREPAAQVVYNGNRFLIKTQSAHYAVDTDKRQYAGISSPDRNIGMGDFPASEGQCATPLVYATIRDAKGIPASVTARLLTL